MARWAEVEREVPELSSVVRELFDAEIHKTIATLRRDGSPRISGIEAKWDGGELWFGSMPRAVKALDLLRDPRFALHSGGPGGDGWRGDAKVAGTAREITDPQDKQRLFPEGIDPGESHLFFADVTEVVVTRLGEPADHIVIESWHPGRGYERRTR
jgi:hypothetical protein